MLQGNNVKTKLVQLIISLSGIKVSDVTGQVSNLHQYLIRFFCLEHIKTCLDSLSLTFVSSRFISVYQFDIASFVIAFYWVCLVDFDVLYVLGKLKIKIKSATFDINSLFTVKSFGYECVHFDVFVLVTQKTLMAHALKRIAFATCFPDQHQFTFIAREPKATTDEQFCHAFRVRSAREVIVAIIIFFSKYLFIFCPCQQQSWGQGFHWRLSVCLPVFFSALMSQKPMQLRSPNLTQKCSTMSPGNLFTLGSKGQGSRVGPGNLSLIPSLPHFPTF